MTQWQLRRLEESDLPARLAWLLHEQALTNMPLKGVYNTATTKAWFDRARQDSTRIDIILTRDNEPVAAGGLTGIDPDGVAELYAFVSPQHRRQGIGRRLVMGLCHFGLTELKLHRLFLWTYATNDSAISLYQQAGFVVEGTLRDHATVGGIRVGRTAMGLLANEWNPGPSAHLGVPPFII